MANEEFIRQQIRRMILEKQEDTKDIKSPPPKEAQKGQVKKGKIGRGKVPAAATEAEALANKNPSELMKRLGVTSAAGTTDEQKVAKVLLQAVRTLKGKKGLETAYNDVSMMQTPEGEVYIKIIPNKLSARNALVYMKHVLVGAVNAGILNIDKNVIPDYSDKEALIKFESV